MACTRCNRTGRGCRVNSVSSSWKYVEGIWLDGHQADVQMSFYAFNTESCHTTPECSRETKQTMICFICSRSGEASGSARPLGLHCIQRYIDCLLCLKLSLCSVLTPAALLSECPKKSGKNKDKTLTFLMHLMAGCMSLFCLEDSCSANLSAEGQYQSAGKKKTTKHKR